tara:strand:+ start:112 stop:777 length:666 start_codon:yes stop_codon:yes gene_type:complete
MYAIVKDNNITQTFNNPKRITINNIRYSTKIYSLWSVDEKKAIGLYEVEYDNTNKKDKDWYINTDQTLAYDSSANKVVASYGTATARGIADVNEVWSQAEIDNGFAPDGTSANDPKNDRNGDQIVTKGLKTIKKEMINNQCEDILRPSDWRVIKAKETGGTMNSGWKTFRASVRTKCNSMQSQIDSASDVDALATLFTYTNTGTEENPVIERPLGEFPEKE